jgi:tight adherence protein B
MTCIPNGILRAHLDGELADAELARITEHLVSCAECRGDLEKQRAEKAELKDLFLTLATPVETTAIDPATAYTAFHKRIEPSYQPKAKWLVRLFAPRWWPAWGLVAFAMVVAILVSVNPIRSWAQRMYAEADMSPVLLAVLVFVVVAGTAFAFGSLFNQRGAQARLIKERLADERKAPERSADDELAILRDEQLSEIPALDSLLRRSSRISELQTILAQGSIDLRAGNFLGLCAILGLALGLVAYLFTSRAEAGWIALLVGAVLPYGYASVRRNHRFEKFEELFPEAIDTLARAVRAGHAFTTALELITDEVAEPVAGEFRQLFEEQKFGMPVRDALMNLTERVPVVDVKFFVTAVMLQRETGGNLAEILDNLSYVIRERFKIQRQVRVYTAQGRLTMALLMGMPPIIVAVMLVVNPGFIHPLFADPIGHALVVCGITLQTLGYFVIRKIIRIQV